MALRQWLLAFAISSLAWAPVSAATAATEKAAGTQVKKKKKPHLTTHVGKKQAGG